MLLLSQAVLPATTKTLKLKVSQIAISLILGDMTVNGALVNNLYTTRLATTCLCRPFLSGFVPF